MWPNPPQMRRLKYHICSLAFIFRFSSRISQSQQKLAKKITHLTMQSRWKNLTYFTNLTSFNIVKKVLPQHSQNLSGRCQKKYLLCTISGAQKLHSWSIGKANVCIFLYISVKKMLMTKIRKSLSGRGLSNFLRWVAVWVS